MLSNYVDKKIWRRAETDGEREILKQALWQVVLTYLD